MGQCIAFYKEQQICINLHRKIKVGKLKQVCAQQYMYFDLCFKGHYRTITLNEFNICVKMHQVLPLFLCSLP